MAIKTIYKIDKENEELNEEVPEFLQEHATEIDGFWVVDITDLEIHPKARALKNALEKEKAKRLDRTEKLTAAEAELARIPEGFEVEKWEELLLMESKAEDPGKQRERIRAEMEKNKKEIRKAIDAENAEAKAVLEAKIAKDKEFIEKIVKKDRLQVALVDNGVDPKLLDGAKALLEPRVKIVEEDDDYKDIIESPLGDISIKEYVAGWVQKDEGKPYVVAVDGPGLKTPRSRQGNFDNIANPFMPGTISLGKQQELFRKDKAKYDLLKKQAEEAK